MKYCARCMYPENAKPTIIFDEEGVCSGCRYHESRERLEVNWQERWKIFEGICDEAKEMAKERGNPHDCIIPVSGGKDSHYQVWLLKEKMGMNPLLVHFNHAFNTPAGRRNLRNLLEKSGCDLVEYHAGIESVRKISRFMLEEVGDVTWHYHAGIKSYPFQVAIERNIPLIVWGEHGFAELTGLISLEDFVEFTRWSRKEHDMRGYEPEDLIGKNGITKSDIAPYVYPTDEELERVEVRGIYLSNFIDWDAKKQTEIIMREWGFSGISFKRERTFNLHSKIEDHAQEVHDYLKFLKFGYGRSTDDTTTEIRRGRLSRAEGVELVKEYDPVTPSYLKYYCDFLGITVKKFYDLVEPMRDENIWNKDDEGNWALLDGIYMHKDGDLEVAASLSIDVENHIFTSENRHLYFNVNTPPLPLGDPELDKPSACFKVF